MRNPFSINLRAAGFVVVLAISCVFTAWGKDFWEEKPFTQWSEQEAMKLLSESPWARTQTVMAGTMAGAQQQSNSDRVKSLPRVASAGSNSGAGLSQTGVSFGAGDSIPLFVRWHSSTRIRQALGRLGQLQQNVPEAEVRKFAEAPVEDYQIAVTGPLLDAFNQMSLTSFQEKSFLTSKKNKTRKIALKSYVAPKDRQDGVALFSFPKQIDGMPGFTAEDDEVEFVAQAGKINLKASFKLAKMMSDGKPDL
jgi:hypothetical protein